MPTKTPPVSTLDQLAERIDGRLDSMGQGIADRLGPPSGSARYTQPQADALWDTPDNSVDSNALYQALQQGITPDGAQAVALFKMAPDLLMGEGDDAILGVPLPPDKAAQIAKLAEYPGRYVLTTGHSQDAEEQVKFVADQQKRAARRQMQTADGTGVGDMQAPQGQDTAPAPMGGQHGY